MIDFVPKVKIFESEFFINEINSDMSYQHSESVTFTDIA